MAVSNPGWEKWRERLVLGEVNAEMLLAEAKDEWQTAILAGF